jgi:uncharacterized phage-associated protein
MANWQDVAKYILERQGEVTAMKLQKLMYYGQAWHLVWAEEPLFPDDFQAWANGPVLPALYVKHKGMFKVNAHLLPQADSNRLTHAQRANVDKVLGFYGTQTAQWLSNLTHQEAPWLQTRNGLQPGTMSEDIIPQSLMHEYYSSL